MCDAIGQASAAAVAVPVEFGGQAVTLGFGPQADTRPVHRGPVVASQPLDAVAVANYIAKYATKTLAAPGVPDTPIRLAAEIAGFAARLITGR